MKAEPSRFTQLSLGADDVLPRRSDQACQAGRTTLQGVGVLVDAPAAGSRSIRVVAVDVGSVRPPSNFAWAEFDAPGRGRSWLVAEIPKRRCHPWQTASARAGSLHCYRKRRWRCGSRRNSKTAGRCSERPVTTRAIDHGRPDTGAGARHGSRSRCMDALDAWLRPCPGLPVTTQPDIWRGDGARLLLVEAFVSGSGKPAPLSAGQNAADVAATGLSLIDRLGAGRELNIRRMP
jgi:hypothetical protein